MGNSDSGVLKEVIQRILVIADDFTGATDIGTAFVETGRSVRVHLAGAHPRPSAAAAVDNNTAEVLIFALKTRSCPVEEALATVQAALDQARYNRLTDQLYFKYCSTFDSTSEGNIGPVLDLLLRVSKAESAVVVPAYPGNGRTQYQGYLFVGDRLLAESHMREHPITPMRDSSVVRLLAAQTDVACELVDLNAVRSDAVEQALSELRDTPRYAIVDAVTDDDLAVIAAHVQHHRLVSGGAGLAKCYSSREQSARVPIRSLESTGRVIIAGSQSNATKRQLAHLQASENLETFVVNAAVEADESIEQCTAWMRSVMGAGKMILVQRPELTGEYTPGSKSAEGIETVLAAAAALAYELGVREFLVAGGESSAAVVQALSGQQLSIGPNIDEGVPWCEIQTADGTAVNIALKSGNFGADDFFTRGWKVLDA